MKVRDVTGVFIALWVVGMLLAFAPDAGAQGKMYETSSVWEGANPRTPHGLEG